MKTVYIIEDEEIVRDLLSTFFAASFPELEILGMARDGDEGIKKCLELGPDLVIVDIQLPEINGLEVLHLLKRKSPMTKILVFTGKTTAQTVKIALQGNADGFVSKLSGLEDLKKAIHAALNDEQYFSPEIHEVIVQINRPE